MEVAAVKFVSSRSLLFRVSLLAVLLSGLGSAPMAQVTASIKGTVTDATGATVAGARVIVKSTAVGIERTTETNTEGEYEVPALPPGNYEVQVQKPGFGAQIAKDVILQVSQNTLQNFSLKVAESNVTVTVEGTFPVIDSTTMTVGQVIDKNVVQEIPLITNFDLALIKNTKITEAVNLQFRADAFDLFNHPNFGQPGGGNGFVVLPATLTPATLSSFTTITSTRFPTADSGSSRQLQLALKLQF